MSGEPNTDAQRASNLSSLATETINAATADIDRRSALEIAQLMNVEDATVAQAVQHELPRIAQAIEAIAARLRNGGRLVYVGAGTSGRLGVLDASECGPTFNTWSGQVIGIIAGGSSALTHPSEDVEDSTEAGKANAIQFGINEKDVLVGITASGRTPYVFGAITYAKQRQAVTIGLTCNAHTPLANEVDIMIAPVVGPEVISGSTRLKAGTAQKMVLNMLSTGAMILLGKTFGNLMVDVHTTNYKLQQRAATIVQIATGLDKETAETLLHASGGETKTAILVGRMHVTPQVARQQLASHGHVLRKALEAMQSNL